MEIVKVFELLEDEWEVYKKLRLCSLQDSPDSFGSTYERENKFSDGEWRSRISEGGQVYRLLPLAATECDKPIGLGVGLIHSSNTEVVCIYQMWVSKSHRGRGVGRSILNQIITWARRADAKKVSLFVNTINTSAIKLYSSAGFQASGRKEKLREGSTCWVQLMGLELQPENA